MKLFSVRGFLIVGCLFLLLGTAAADSGGTDGETRLGPPISWENGEFDGDRVCPRPAVSDSPAYSGCGGGIAPLVNGDYEEQVTELVNAERADRGLPPLKRVIGLDQSARYHATDMGQDNYFDHDTYDRSGGSLVYVCNTWDRIRVYYPSPRAENIAAGYTSPQSVMSGWMNSPGHRANILSTSSWELGVGYYSGGGSYYRYWVQNFGRRSGVYPLIINREAATTSSPQVSLYVYGDWDEIRLRNDDEAWSDWIPFEPNLDWTLKGARGERTVSAEMRSGGETASSSDEIFLDLQVIPPEVVVVSGPTSGLPGTSYTFTADVSPAEASQPLTYLWQATDQEPVTHQGGVNDTVSFSWVDPGSKTVTVTVSNDGGGVTANYQIDVLAPVTAVTLNGPAPVGGYVVNTYYTFDAAVSPITATRPITYVWQASGEAPVTHVGGLSDSLTVAWTVTGSQGIGVAASNAAGEEVTDVEALTVVDGPCVDVGPEVEARLVYTDGQGNPTEITVPPQAVAESISLRYVPLIAPQPYPADKAFAGHAFRLEAYLNGTLQPTLVLFEPFTITLSYSPSDVRPMDKDRLGLYIWDGGDWLDASATCGHTALLPQFGQGWLEVEVCELGQFALFGIQHQVYLPIVIR